MILLNHEQIIEHNKSEYMRKVVSEFTKKLWTTKEYRDKHLNNIVLLKSIWKNA